MGKPLTIIMVAKEHVEQTIKALESLAEHTDPADYKLVFFDQSEGPETAGLVPQFCHDHGIEHNYILSTNIGYIGAVNHCYQFIDTPFSLTCHNDVVFSKWWLRNMMRKFDDPQVAAVGPVITYALGQQSVNFAYQTLGYKVKFLLGLFFMARQSVLNEVKEEFNDSKFWLNPVYGMGDKEELEFCYLITQLGYKLAIARDVLIEHEGEKSFIDLLGSKEKFTEYQNKKLELLKSRLGEDVVNDIYTLTPEKEYKVLIGVMTRTNYVHAYFAFSFAGVYATTPVFKSLLHIPRGHVAESRNAVVEEAIKKGYTHVCFIDDDMTFDSDTLTKLLLHEVDFCTGIAFQRNEPYMICIFRADHENKVMYPVEAIDIGVVPIDACGGYFLLADIDVFKKVPKPWFKYGDTALGYNDKKEDGTIGEGIGEDVYFGLKATLNGFKGYADSDLEIKHIGYEKMVGKDTFWDFKKETNGTFKKEERVIFK
jgi:hypothetical protein